VEQPVASVQKRVTICNVKGLHARASAKFASKALEFRSRVTVTKDGTTVNASSIMGLLLLAASTGQSIVISAEGPDAVEALAALEHLVESKFDET
jgi:phosphocarrier protein HPr